MKHQHTPPDLVETHLVEARKWFAWGANKGDRPASAAAAYWLAQMYWDGKGGPQDKDRAKYIWMWSAQHGYAPSKTKLAQLKYDEEQERLAAIAKAQGRQQKSSNERAQEGLAIVFGLLFLASLTSVDCRSLQQGQLMGTVDPRGVPDRCK